MIRRIVSILLILPAIGIILAHAVIPHHHHEDQVCFDIQNCHATHDCDSEHQSHGQNCYVPHNHNKNLPEKSESSDCCSLKENLVFHPGQQRHELVCPTHEINYHQRLHVVVLAISIHTGKIVMSGMLPFRQKPLIIPHLSNIAAYTPGLRAPPYC